MNFVNPFFLLGLLAVAVPILVHLFNFRRYKKIFFSNVEFLQELQIETRKQSKLRSLLVLASRILAIMFLVLAFAQPFIPSGKKSMKQGGSAVSVYIDNSFSMENTNGEGTLLEMAKSKAREIAMAYKPSDEFQLISNSMSGKEFRWVNREEFLSMIDELKISPATRRLSEVMEKQLEFIRENHSKNPFIYQISDFQKSIADFDAMPEDSLVDVTFVPLEASKVNNLFIDTLSFNAPGYYEGNLLEVLVSVKNIGDENVEKVPLKLSINGKQRALASIDLKGGESCEIPLRCSINEKGILHGEIELMDYPVTFDDKMYFCINVTDRISLTTIQNGTENPFLHKLFANDSSIVYSVFDENNVNFSTLPNSNTILLNELKSIPSGMGATLREFVENGGTIIVIPTESCDIHSYNQLLSALGCPQLSSWKNREEKVANINFKSTLYKNVFEGENGNIDRPNVKGHFSTTVSSSTNMEEIMAFGNGETYLSLTHYREGKVFLLSSALRTEYSDFVQQALFVPTLYNMVLYSRPASEFFTWTDFSSPIPLSQSKKSSNGVASLKAIEGDFEIIPDMRKTGGRSYILLHGEISQAGNYVLRNENSEDEGLAFNYNRMESDMRFLSRHDISESSKKSGLQEVSVIRNSEKSLQNLIKERTEGKSLWRLCLLLALLFLLIETVLIRWPKKKESVDEIILNQ